MQLQNGFFDKKIRDMEKLKPILESQQLDAVQGALTKSLGSDKVTRTKTSVSATSESVGSSTDVIDLKKSFRQSSKARLKRNGGWYLIVPIRRYTSRKKKDSARGMSKKMYEELRQAPNGNVVSDYLYSNRRPQSQVQELNYTTRSQNITKMDNKKGRGSTYVSFRVVSDKSPANSWLLNRDQVDPDDLSEEARRIVNQVRGFKSN